MLDTLRVEHVNSKRFWILLIAYERVNVEGGLLVGVLAVAQGVRTIPGAGELGRELGGIDFSVLILPGTDR